MIQEQRVPDYMTKNGSINPMEALSECGVMRLAARIDDPRRANTAIKTEWVTVRNRWGEDCRVARYSLNAGLDRQEEAR